MRHTNEDFRFILYWHSDIVRQKWLGRLFIGLEKRAAKKADLIITASRNCMEGSRTLKSYRKKCRVVPHKRVRNSVSCRTRERLFERSCSFRRGSIFCRAIGKNECADIFKKLVCRCEWGMAD